MSSSLEAVKEELKAVEDTLQSAQDPARLERLEDERRQLRAELRRLEQAPGACSSNSYASDRARGPGLLLSGPTGWTSYSALQEASTMQLEVDLGLGIALAACSDEQAQYTLARRASPC